MAQTDERVWDPQVVMALLSTERMSTYLDACQGSTHDAFALYRRNIDIASSIQTMPAGASRRCHRLCRA